MQYVLLFIEGIITFISPCLLPLLPVYISYFAAGEANKRRTLTNALGFSLGFTLVFVILGAFAGTFGRLLGDYAVIVNIVTGLVVIVLGLNFTGLINIKFLKKTVSGSANTKNLTFFSSVLFGIVFSIGWTPCVGTFLASALALASNQGGTVNGMLMLLVYSLGLAVPFVASALLIDRLKGMFDFIKKNYKLINILSGALLIIMGILMATGTMGRLLSLLSF